MPQKNKKQTAAPPQQPPQKNAARRSQRWFARDDLRSFGHRSRAKQMGWEDADFTRPVIAIVNTWSELNTCHMHLQERAQDVRHGIIQAGGTPVELPAFSLGEQLMKPSAMMYRNLLAMQTEEMLRAYPIDGAVLMGGCDKTTPGLLMGAISANLPCIYLPAGAMMRGHFRDETLASGTDVWRYWDEKRVGKITKQHWLQIEDGIARTAGTCMSMGTAATMMIAAEAMGMSLLGAASVPAVDSQHRRLAKQTGRRAVAMVAEQLAPAKILNRDSFINATAAVVLCGGSTNAIIHLTALARRAGVEWTPQHFAEVANRTPLLLNLKPSGDYVMEDFHRAGGTAALWNQAQRFFKLNAKTISGKTFLTNIYAAATAHAATIHNANVIRPPTRPLQKNGGLKVLRGSLAPDGCIIKTSAAAKHLHKHAGHAVVFENMADLKKRINAPDLQVDADSVLVLKNAGPVGAPGMPEWGQLPIPQKLLAAGIKDMLRISDARMSGTSYGACVLHVAPEAAVGGALALVQNGDLIKMDINKGRLDLCVDEKELQARRAAWHAAQQRRDKNAGNDGYPSGYGWLYKKHVLQANEGCDFDFASQTPADTRQPDIF